MVDKLQLTFDLERCIQTARELGITPREFVITSRNIWESVIDAEKRQDIKAFESMLEIKVK